MNEIQITAVIVKKVSDATNSLIDLITKLIFLKADIETQYLEGKARIQKLKEIVELREASKTIQNLYISKGSIIADAKNITKRNDVKSAELIKGVFSEAVVELKKLKKLLGKIAFSDTSLATQAATQITKAIEAYQLVLSIDANDLIKENVLEEVCACLEKLKETGDELITKLDHHRLLLDQCYE